MLKRLILGVVATLFFAFQLHIGTAFALKIDKIYRTVKFNDSGEEIVLSNEQIKTGKKLFDEHCSQCHNSGRTKNNPNVTLKLEDLAGAEPARDNIAGMTAYLQHPTTYDGEIEIDEFHPNTSRPDLYAEMRNYTEDDLKAVSGYVLSTQKIRESWGKGKVYD
ncbi:MAG: cytochrome c-550 [Moorea sp. SIO2B7]|nr:cytochrome c-550 [Moorena sp. SIO2B7]